MTQVPDYYDSKVTFFGKAQCLIRSWRKLQLAYLIENISSRASWGASLSHIAENNDQYFDHFRTFSKSEIEEKWRPLSVSDFEKDLSRYYLICLQKPYGNCGTRKLDVSFLNYYYDNKYYSSNIKVCRVKRKWWLMSTWLLSCSELSLNVVVILPASSFASEKPKEKSDISAIRA